MLSSATRLDSVGPSISARAAAAMCCMSATVPPGEAETFYRFTARALAVNH
jgi:hypothetical protein